MSSSLMLANPVERDGWILIEETVVTTMLSFRQDEVGKPEAGGILLGYRRGIHIHVVDATIPRQKDKRSLFGFFRKDPYHGKYAVKQWKSSREFIDYVGEWHTHPEPDPHPSSIDLFEWKEICKSRNDPMAFIIVGDRGKLWIGVGKCQAILTAGFD